MTKKTVTLLILDGWGLRQETDGNAIELAHPTHYQRLLETCPWIPLDASGEAVGLPDGQMGNSEVGHLNMGAGRIVYQEITRINKSIREGDFYQNNILLEAINHARKNDTTLHLMGLVSDGGVHSSLTHLMALLDLCKQNNLEKVRVHAFLDGRDVPPQSAEIYLGEVEAKLEELGFPQIATINGRYYAMDRDNRWERTQQAYDNIVEAKGRRHFLSIDALKYNYSQGVNDEFVVPSVTDFTYEGMVDNDSIIFFNFRPDRARQITRALTQKVFDGFQRTKQIENLYFACMTLYDETFGLPVAYPKQHMKRILAEIVSENGMTQFRTAETEKYAHVTFFFNGGFEDPYPGEDRKLIPSPKVATYDLQPEMHVDQVADSINDALKSGKYDLIVANFANPDMVGHTGILPAAIDAVKAIDVAIQRVVETIRDVDGVLLITADHGNVENMHDAHGGPHTAHTTSLVPLIMVSNDVSLKLDNSKLHNLSDISPTILSLLNLPQPPEMTSESLLVRSQVTA